jgi:hypothetical protein
MQLHATPTGPPTHPTHPCSCPERSARRRWRRAARRAWRRRRARGRRRRWRRRSASCRFWGSTAARRGAGTRQQTCGSCVCVCVQGWGLLTVCRACRLRAPAFRKTARRDLDPPLSSPSMTRIPQGCRRAPCAPAAPAARHGGQGRQGAPGLRAGVVGDTRGEADTAEYRRQEGQRRCSGGHGVQESGARCR